MSRPACASLPSQPEVWTGSSGYEGQWLRKGQWIRPKGLFFAPQDDVERPVAAMALMRDPHAGDAIGIAAGFQPVADLAANGAAARTAACRRAFRRFPRDDQHDADVPCRSEEHTSELQSLMRISYAVFCLKKKKYNITDNIT